DTATNTVIAIIPVGSSPRGVAVTPDGAKVYATNHYNNNVSVIDTATNTVIATVSIGNGPIAVAIIPDGTKVYVANYGSANVSVIDTATNAVIATIPVGNSPQGVAVNPDGTKVYVTNSNSNNVSVIDTATNTVIATIPVGSSPQGVAVTPDGAKVYVANNGDSTVSLIDTATNTVIATIPVGSSPVGVSVIPDGTRVYVANAGSNTVSVINTTTNNIVITVAVGNTPFAFGQFIGPTNPLVLAPGQNITGTANYIITQTDLDSGFVTNSAFANGTFNGNNVTSDVYNKTVTANQTPALLTVKIASPTIYSTLGQNIMYIYTVNNSGNVGISAPINITDNRTGEFTISNSALSPGQNVTGTANYTITQTDLDSGFVNNSAFATGIFNGTEVESPNVTATVTANQRPALLTVKIASPANYSAAGQSITYT
ncbi:MAG: DUF7507 domain-containing protein, partial [Methanosarcina sp.]